MQEGKFSKTAYRVAIRRAAHQIFDDPKVLDDPFALRIIGSKTAEVLRTDPKEAKSRFGRAFRAFLSARGRFAEDELAQAVANGVTQYVVLSAGLDTFAYRNPYPSLRVFEVDHPASQTWKQELLTETRIAIPPSLTFVPVNFEHQTLVDGLDQSGFNRNQPAFFSWLGVTMYLTRESCMATFALISKMPPGSGVAFDFAVDPKLLGVGQRLALYALSRRVAAAGEPFQLFLHPRGIRRRTKAAWIHPHRNLEWRSNERPLFQRSWRQAPCVRRIGPVDVCLGVSDFKPHG
jgi:methyltransferase (TIGR00027 family)